MKIKNLVGSFAITALVLSGAISQVHAIGTSSSNYVGIDGTEA